MFFSLSCFFVVVIISNQQFNIVSNLHHIPLILYLFKGCDRFVKKNQDCGIFVGVTAGAVCIDKFIEEAW